MVKIELSEEQVQALLELVNTGAFRGDGAEKVIELKKALSKGLETEKPEAEKKQ